MQAKRCIHAFLPHPFPQLSLSVSLALSLAKGQERKGIGIDRSIRLVVGKEVKN